MNLSVFDSFRQATRDCHPRGKVDWTVGEENESDSDELDYYECEDVVVDDIEPSGHHATPIDIPKSPVRRVSSSQREFYVFQPDDKFGIPCVQRRSRPLWHKGSLGLPEGVAGLASGEVAVADSSRGAVDVLNQEGVYMRSSILTDSRVGLLTPLGVTQFIQDKLLVTISKRSYLMLIDSDDMSTREFPLLPWQEHSSPYGVAFSPYKDTIALTHCSDLISLHDKDGRVVREISHPGTYWYIAADTVRHRLLLTDCHNHCVTILDMDSRNLAQFSSEGHFGGQLRYPHGVCCDPQGHILVADGLNNRVSRFSADGRFIDHVLSGGDGVRWPRALYCDGSGQLTVSWRAGVSSWFINSTDKFPLCQNEQCQTTTICTHL